MSEKKGRKEILKEEGASRAVVSGSFSFIFAILGSLLLFVFTVLATGNPGLAYYGAISATLGIFNVLGSGLGQAFLARIKKSYVEDDYDQVIIRASSFTKVYVILGVILGGILLVLSLLMPDPFMSFILLMSIPPILLNYIFGTLRGMLNMKNRFDITGFVGSFFGTVVFIVGGIFILLGLPAVYFTLSPFFISLNTIVMFLYFNKRVSDFKIKDLYLKGKLMSPENKEFIKYSFFSTLTNLESIGVLGNLIIFLTTILLFFWYPSIQLLAVQILTIVMTYAIVKVAIIFFSGPLNIEIAEAVSKGNHHIVQDTITDIGRFAFLIGLILMTIVCSGSAHILSILHRSLFLESNGSLNEELLLMSQLILIFCAVGQACYGFAALFGNALIGSGHGKDSALIFGITLILTIILTPVSIFFWGYMGAGITMLLTGLFVLPYMLLQIKKDLKVKLNFRLPNMVPILLILFLLIYFYPLQLVLEHLRYSNHLAEALVGLIMLFGIILTFLVGIPFFGVMGPGDGKLISDLTQSFNAEWLGNFALILGKYFYYLNPLHKKLE